MNHAKRVFNQRDIIVLLLVLLAMSIGVNAYLFFGVIKPLQEGRGEEETCTLPSGVASQMWDEFSVELTPNRAVLSLESDRKFNVSIKGSYWAPFDYGPRPFYFKIYNRSTDYKGAITSDEPELLIEETVFANKPKDELNYIILAHFTVILDTGGTHIYTIIGAAWSNVTLDHWDCIATFALNIGA